MYNHLQELLKKLHIEQNEHHIKSGCNTCATSGKRLCKRRYHAHYIPKQDRQIRLRSPMSEEGEP